MVGRPNLMNDECICDYCSTDETNLNPIALNPQPFDFFIFFYTVSLPLPFLHNSYSAINRCLCTLWIRWPISIRINSFSYLDSTLFYLFQYETNENLLRFVARCINEPNWVCVFFFLFAAGAVAVTCAILLLVFMAGCHRGVWHTCVPIININKLSSLILIDIAK